MNDPHSAATRMSETVLASMPVEATDLDRWRAWVAGECQLASWETPQEVMARLLSLLDEPEASCSICGGEPFDVDTIGDWASVRKACEALQSQADNLRRVGASVAPPSADELNTAMDNVVHQADVIRGEIP